MIKRLLLLLLTILLSIIIYSKRPQSEKIQHVQHVQHHYIVKNQPIHNIMVGGGTSYRNNIVNRQNRNITYKKLQGDYSTLNEKNKTSHTILPSLSA